ncbi:hypothetical protein [Actinomyces oris]|uniref:hypothetical protein n=2 Tax=Actinomyces TaxID=1654 RepID=UPI000AED76CF|nr:hypothetical protein [Actinomyces oris]
MPTLRREFVAGLVTFAASAAIAACRGPYSRGGTQPSASAPPSNQQEGAPYPADMEHLDKILAIGEGHSLPEDAQVSSVAPATNFAKEFPGGWGYVIAFTATDSAIRRYVTENTIHSGDIIEDYSTAKPGDIQLSDLNLDGISNPWDTGITDGVLVLERPLGRGWLIINGSSR